MKSQHISGNAVDIRLPFSLEKLILFNLIILEEYQLSETKGKDRRKIRRKLRKLRKQIKP